MRTVSLPPDWSAILALPPDDWPENVSDLAGEWPTCAIGELVAKYPGMLDIENFQAPVDSVLYSFGMDFMRAIDVRDPDFARERYAQIQIRFAEIQRGAPQIPS